jgi:L-fuculose-phosphate aldolase
MAEQYSGTKYETIFLLKENPQHPLIRELSDWCRIFDNKGLAPPYDGGSYGNLSFRVDSDSFIITASQSSLADSVTDDRFVYVDSVWNGFVYVIGTRKASSEAQLHLEIYKKRKDVNAVFHGHCREVTENACRLGIPVTGKFEPYGTSKLIEQVSAILGTNKYIEMRDHGFISMGKDMAEAGQLALEYQERCCKLH